MAFCRSNIPHRHIDYDGKYVVVSKDVLDVIKYLYKAKYMANGYYITDKQDRCMGRYTTTLLTPNIKKYQLNIDWLELELKRTGSKTIKQAFLRILYRCYKKSEFICINSLFLSL